LDNKGSVDSNWVEDLSFIHTAFCTAAAALGSAQCN